MLTQQEMSNKYHEILKKEGKLYEKFNPVIARPAIVGEKIVTITSDGKETENIANEGDYVIQNSTQSKEQYIISSEKFKNRYKEYPEDCEIPFNPPNGFSFYLPTGTTIAIKYDGEDTEFIAPWNEPMVLKNGDYICSIDSVEIYRIGNKEFNETYKLSSSQLQWIEEKSFG